MTFDGETSNGKWSLKLNHLSPCLQIACVPPEALHRVAQVQTNRRNNLLALK